MKTQTKIALFFTGLVILIFTVFGFVFHAYIRNDFQARQSLNMLESIVKSKSLAQVRDSFEHVNVQSAKGAIYTQKGIFVHMYGPIVQDRAFYRTGDDTFFITCTHLSDMTSICVAEKITKIQQEQARSLRVYITFSLIFSAFTYFIGLVFANFALKPIRTINEYSRKFRHNNYEKIPHPRGCRPNDDICKLINTLNKLFERVSSENERLARFSSDVSHEFKNSLFEMRSTIELIAKKKTYESGLKTLEKRIDSLNSLIGSLLLLAKIEGEGVPRAMTDLKRTIKGLPVLDSTKDDGPSIILKLQKSAQPVNKELLEIALTNLIGNAIKFTPKDKSITITLTENMIKVQDEGIGMDTKELECIWDRFYKASESRQYGTGHGLGLAITKEIIENVHKWRITATSKKGEGSEFIIRFS